MKKRKRKEEHWARFLLRVLVLLVLAYLSITLFNDLCGMIFILFWIAFLWSITERATTM